MCQSTQGHGSGNFLAHRAMRFNEGCWHTQHLVFGGVGNLWGTLVSAFALGVANKFLEPVAGAVLAKIFILVLLILFIQKRPRGLFALKGRAVEA